MDNNAWSKNKFTSPHESEGPHVNDVRIGKLGLEPGDEFLYIYDYGDNWEFHIKLEDIIKDYPELKEPRVIEAKGNPPPQYPSYDEEDEL